MKNFQFIPVLDLKEGRAVSAYKGERDDYQALTSPLSATSDPVSVAKALLDVSGSETLYLADIDAIQGIGENAGIIDGLADGFPDIELWADAGLSREEEVLSTISHGAVTPVVGSESLTSLSFFSPRLPHFSDRYVLSLDFKALTFLGPEDLMACPEIWPDRVIVMTLDRVGSHEGPNISLIEQILDKAGERRVFSAGGLRHMEDAMALRNRGVAGVLSASAFHNGQITQKEIAVFSARNGDS